MRSSRSSSSRRTSFAVLLALGVSLGSGAAWAQACCVGANLLSPARLLPHEDFLVAIESGTTQQVGTLDSVGRARGNPTDTGELTLSQTAMASVRFLDKAQATLQIPLVEHARWVPGLADWGVGLGDVSLSARVDLLLAGESARVPGIALLAGLRFPAGRAPEQARQPLGADAVGAGAWQGLVGAAVEQSVGRFTLQVSALAQQSLPRSVGGITQTLGPQFTLGAAAGFSFESGAALALTAVTVGTLPSWIDGVVAANTGRWRTTVGVSGAVPLSEDWRLQGAFTGQLPFGFQEPLTVALTVLLMRTWS